MSSMYESFPSNSQRTILPRMLLLWSKWKLNQFLAKKKTQVWWVAFLKVIDISMETIKQNYENR